MTNGTHLNGTKTGTKLLAAAAALAMIAGPASAKLVKLTIAGTITAGTDSGSDLIDEIPIQGGGWTEVTTPGTIFGTTGDLTGKSIKFSFVYDTASPLLPVGAGGIFEDLSGGEWTYTLNPTITVGGVATQFTPLQPFGQNIALTAELGVVDGSPDGLSGDFTSWLGWGDVVSYYNIGSFNFHAALPPGYFSTDAQLPGSLPGPGFGFAGSGASGTGSFSMIRQSCFMSCPMVQAVGTFSLTAITFGAVPEPAAWSFMLAGFAVVGAASRRRRRLTLVTA